MRQNMTGCTNTCPQNRIFVRALQGPTNAQKPTHFAISHCKTVRNIRIVCVFKLFGQGFVQDKAPAMHKVQAIGEKGDSAESSRELP